MSSTSGNGLFGYAQSLASYALRPLFTTVTSNNASYNSALQKLLSIGVPQNDAVQALDAAGGDVKEAARILSEQLKRESKQRAMQHKRQQKMSKKRLLKDPHKMVHRRAQRENQKFKRYSTGVSRKLAVGKKKDMNTPSRLVRFEETDSSKEMESDRQIDFTRSLARSTKFRRGTPMPKKRAHLEDISDDDGSNEDLAIMNVISSDDDMLYSSSEEEGKAGYQEYEENVQVDRRSSARRSVAKKSPKNHAPTSNVSTTRVRQTPKSTSSRQRSVEKPAPACVLASLLRSSSCRRGVPKQQKLNMFRIIVRIGKHPETVVPLAHAVNELAINFAAAPEKSLLPLQRLHDQYPAGAAAELLKLLHTYPTLLSAAATQLNEKAANVRD